MVTNVIMAMMIAEKSLTLCSTFEVISCYTSTANLDCIFLLSKNMVNDSQVIIWIFPHYLFP
jgi:hypothetical protein